MAINTQTEQKITLTKDDSSLQTLGDIISTLCDRLFIRLITWFPPCLICACCFNENGNELDCPNILLFVFSFYISLVILGSLFDIANMIWLKARYGKIKRQEMFDFLLLPEFIVAIMYAFLFIGLAIAVVVLIFRFFTVSIFNILLNIF